MLLRRLVYYRVMPGFHLIEESDRWLISPDVFVPYFNGRRRLRDNTPAPAQGVDCQRRCVIAAIDVSCPGVRVP